MSKNDGGPAFPLYPLKEGEWTCNDAGMSLRDWFAGKALAGISSNPSFSLAIKSLTSDKGKLPGTFMAEVAYNLADAMLKVRES